MKLKFFSPIADANPFKGTPIENSFQTLLDLGWNKSEFAIVGSSALHLLSTTAVSRGFDPLMSRAPNDIDLLVIGETKKLATDMGIRTDSSLSRGYLLSLQIDENKGDLLDVTTAWPTGKMINTAEELRGLTENIGGIQVMKPDFILELKMAFNRVKDQPDIIAAKKGLNKIYKQPTPFKR